MADTDASQIAAAATEQGKRWQDATDKLRARAETSAKAVGALGTTAITAAGLSKFSDIYPLRPVGDISLSQWLAIAGVILGFLAMAAAIVWLTARLWDVVRPIFMSPRDDRMIEELGENSEEYKIVKRVYDDAAELNRAKSLHAYAQRGLRQERIAVSEQPVSGQAKLAAAEAAQIRADVYAAMQQAATRVVRRRAHNAINSGWTLGLYALFVAGLLAFGIGADYLSSERSDRIATAKACAEAVKAIRDADPKTTDPDPAKLLPALCGGEDAVPNPVTSDAAAAAAASPETETSGAAKDVAARYDTCVVAAKGDETKCARLAVAAKSLMP